MKGKTLVWADQNLDVSHFQNGLPIKRAKTPLQWLQFSESQTPAFIQTDGGKLYNYYAVKSEHGLAPKGWRIPHIDELSDLVADGWILRSDIQLPLDGYCSGTSGTIFDVGLNGFYYGFDDSKHKKYLRAAGDMVYIFSVPSEGFGFSVRCVKKNT